MKLLYIAYSDVSVFDSQVVALLNYYSKQKLFEEIVFLMGVHYKSKKRIGKIDSLDSNIKVLIYEQFPQHFFVERFTVKSIKSQLRKIENIDQYVVHVRNDVLAHYVVKAFKSLNLGVHKIIADVRGAGLEQLLEYSDKSKLFLTLKRLQRNKVMQSLRSLKALTAVSVSLKNYLKEKDIDASKIHVVSCLANKSFSFDQNERENMRGILQLHNEDTLFILATGGNNAWQNTEKTIDLLLERGFKVLNLSRSSIEKKDVINKFVPYAEVYKYLCAADIAIIWREQSITNKVASPVKFSEYVCSGLPVITNQAIDLITDFVKSKNCGEIVESLEEIDNTMMTKIKKMNREEISNQGIGEYGIEQISRRYMNVYSKL
ncbi:MAG: hypothetical protein QNJ57_07455 [Flavobacteriaceae bacterium]|nr:hypothetical protein [Flavobacteriaceae bacterium]